jgi:hypothetical protein
LMNGVKHGLTNRQQASLTNTCINLCFGTTYSLVLAVTMLRSNLSITYFFICNNLFHCLFSTAHQRLFSELALI